MQVFPVPKSKKKFIQDLKKEFEYSEEEIAFALKRVEQRIQEKHLTTQTEIENAYGEVYASLIVDDYYKRLEPDYLDKMLEQASKELNEKYPITKK